MRNEAQSGRPAVGLRPAPASAYRLRIEAAQLDESLYAIPRAVRITALLATLLLGLSWRSPHVGPMLDLFALVLAASAASSVAAGLLTPRPRRRTALRRGRAVARLLAFAVGSTFAAILLVALLDADAGGRLVVFAALAIGLGGAWLFGPLASVGLCYMTPIAVCAVGFACRGDEGALLAPIALLAAGGLAAGLRQRETAMAAALADRLLAAERAETMDALLLDQENGGGWIWEIDASGRLRNVGAGFVAASARPAERLEGMLFKSILAPTGPTGRIVPASAGACAVRQAIADRAPFHDVLVEIAAPEGALWWRLSGRPGRDGSGAFTGFRGIGTDVTATRNWEARIAYLAGHDSLTGLANRERFLAHAARECAAATADGRWRALLTLDLDGFKTINDSLGHAAGDRVLGEVARRLKAAAPDAEIARLGGDEFALWILATPAKAEALAQRLIEMVGVPYEIEAGTAAIAASVGIAYAPKHATQPDALLGKADLALYRAKAEGKGIVRTFQESDETAIVEKRKLDADLKLALARGELELFYQPLVGLARGEVVAFEALIRWRSPTRGFVAPADFIPAAEASGLIAGIGRFVLNRACRDAALWPDDVRVAVNVSPRQFADADFPRNVALALQASGLAPTRLEIEVTESVFLDNSATARAHLTALRERGIRIALDDFGTGYSSLSYLTNFPVDKIKIDRSFVQSLDRIETQAIVEAIVALARRLSIDVVAEGVETAEQALSLRVRRCDDLQGYLLSRPRPAAEVPAMLTEAPAALRAAVPTASESPLALALAMRRKAG